MLTRRNFLHRSGALLVGSLALPGLARTFAAPNVSGHKRVDKKQGIVTIVMKSDPSGAHVWFDPIGIYVEPGQTIRWQVMQNVHTATAYHPKNDNHCLRIPENALPWNSGFLVNPDEHYDVTLTVEGVYDYYCIPHEMVGMVGRIIVGHATGPGSLPFDYYMGKPGTASWKAVPDAAKKAFPSIEQIMREKVVHFG